jgi:phospholipid/cholesterol/gamma-HCH transport system substrate-binding protein
LNINKVMLLKVMIFALICSVFTVLLGVKLANSRLFSETYVLQAEFDDATGVLKGDAVKLAGVDIGRVETAEIEKGEAVVTFNLDDGVQLPKDSEVAIRWRNVLGQRYLYVYPGTGSEMFADGDRIPDDQTRDVNDIGEFLNRVGPILKAIDPEQANAFLDSVNTALTGNEQDVRQLIDDGAKLFETLADEDDEIKGLLDSADTVTAAYASQDQALGDIFENLDDVGVVLERRTKDINTLVDDFAIVQQKLNDFLVENRENIDVSLDKLDSVAGNLAANKKNLGKTLRSLPLGLLSYHQTSSWGEYFNVRLIKLVVQDSNSDDVVVQEELENQHGDTGGEPRSGDGCVPCPDNKKGSGGSGSGKGSATEDSVDRPQGIETILRFMLTGAAR